MNYFRRIVKYCLLGMAGLMAAGLVTVIALYIFLIPKLPDIETLKDVHLQVRVTRNSSRSSAK